MTLMSGKTRRPSGTMTMPSLTMASGAMPSMRLPSKCTSPLRSRLKAGDGAQDRGLAGAVGANQRDGLALVDLDRHALQRVDVIVVELGIGDREKQGHRYIPIDSSSMPR